MGRNKPKNSTEAGKKLIRSIFSTIGVSIFLLIINVKFSPHIWWSLYPILFLSLSIVFPLFEFLGLKASEKYEEKQTEKKFRKEEALKLKELEVLEQRKKNGGFDEEDFV